MLHTRWTNRQLLKTTQVGDVFCRHPLIVPGCPPMTFRAMWANRIGIVSHMLQTPVVLAAVPQVSTRECISFPRRFPRIFPRNIKQSFNAKWLCDVYSYAWQQLFSSMSLLYWSDTPTPTNFQRLPALYRAKLKDLHGIESLIWNVWRPHCQNPAVSISCWKTVALSI